MTPFVRHTGSDVNIVGAGIVGCATAYFLARQGAAVTVFDPVGIAAGASGRNNGLVEHPYDPATEGLFEATVGLLSEVLGDRFPREPVGALLIARDEEGARQLAHHYRPFPSLAPEVLTPRQMRESEPLLVDGLWGCLLRTGHPIMPLEATTAFADLARAAGTRFVLGEPVDLAGLRASGGEVVVAAGAGTSGVLGDLLRPETITPLWGVIVSVELPQRPNHPLIEGALALAHGGGTAVESPFTLLDSPGWLAVGSTMIEGSEPDSQLWAARLLERGTQFVPSIAEARIRGVMTCARPRSFDNRPILGRVPGEERLWIAAGHGGRGMSTGAASGRLMAASIIAGSDAAIPAVLSARRLAP